MPSMTGAPIPETLGRYRLLSKIAKGGMAEVFAARSYGSHGFEKTVALKRILPRFGRDPQFVRMMVDEAKISVLLHHPNIAQILELGEQADVDGQPEYFIVMEFVAGQSLSAVIKRMRENGDRFPQLEACFTVVELLQGLHAAHIQTDMSGKPARIIHRDVSPQNTLVSFDGHVKVIDFGIARARDRLEATEVGTIKGKLRYLAPEMIDPGRFTADGDFDHRVDVFAAGIVLWELIAGRTLFPGDDELKVYDEITDGVTPDLHKEGLCDAALMKIIAKALERRLNKRYDSAEAFADDLRAYVYRKDPGFTHKRVAAILDRQFPAEKAELTSLERGISPNGSVPQPPSRPSQAPQPAETRHMRSDKHHPPAQAQAPAPAVPAVVIPSLDAPTAVADRDALDPHGELRKDVTVMTLVSRQHVLATGTAGTGAGTGATAATPGRDSRPFSDSASSGVFSTPDDATLTVSADTLREEQAKQRAREANVSANANASRSNPRSPAPPRERSESRPAARREEPSLTQRPAPSTSTSNRGRLIAISAAVGTLLAIGIVAMLELFAPRPSTPVTSPTTPTSTTTTTTSTPPPPTTTTPAPKPIVRVVLQSPAAGAVVHVTGARGRSDEQSGPAPFAVDAAPGDALAVRVVAAGVREEVETLMVPADQAGDLVLDLQPRYQPVPLAIVVTPPTAAVLVDGEAYAAGAVVTPGDTVVVDVSAPGFVAVRKELTPAPGAAAKLVVALEKAEKPEKPEKPNVVVDDKTPKKKNPPPPPPPPATTGTGTLTLKTTPYWGNVTIDGKAYDEQTPLTLTLPAGKHDVVVSHPPKGLVRKLKVIIKPGETISRLVSFE